MKERKDGSKGRDTCRQLDTRADRTQEGNLFLRTMFPSLARLLYTSSPWLPERPIPYLLFLNFLLLLLKLFFATEYHKT